jgi:triphosphoribosyl-dephospho-CoA synthase
MTAPAFQFEPLASRAPTARAGIGVAFATRIADRAVEALLAELAAWPKPGLVSYIDPGSHEDMDAALLEASALSLHPFFAELTETGQRHSSMDALREIGIRAEAKMLSVTGGVNTHRGAIFGLGLLCAAVGFQTGAQLEDTSMGSVVAQQWGKDIHRGPIPLFSHGSTALRCYGAGGARAEAAAGFPSIYEVGLPALRKGRRLRPTDSTAAAVQACFALIATVEDTNLLHRGGKTGAQYAAEAARCFLAAGGVGAKDWRARAAAIHSGFVRQRLSPGGCADLLAMTIFIDTLEHR